MKVSPEFGSQTKLTEVSVATSIVGTSYSPSFLTELNVARFSIFERFKDAKHYDDFLEVFEEEVEELMKQWGTWKPLEQMHIIEMSDDGKVESRRPINMWRNVNFWDECNFLGLGGAGFTSTFAIPDGRNVRARYWHEKKELNFEYV